MQEWTEGDSRPAQLICPLPARSGLPVLSGQKMQALRPSRPRTMAKTVHCRSARLARGAVPDQGHRQASWHGL